MRDYPTNTHAREVNRDNNNPGIFFNDKSDYCKIVQSDNVYSVDVTKNENLQLIHLCGASAPTE